MAKEVRVLNRIVRRHPKKEITYDADHRHEERIIRDTTRFERAQIERKAGKQGGNHALSADEVTRYRRIAARANFLAPDRMDIAYATKEATRKNDGTHNWPTWAQIGPGAEGQENQRPADASTESGTCLVLEQDTGRSGSEFTRSRIGCSSESESRSSRDDVVVERHR